MFTFVSLLILRHSFVYCFGALHFAGTLAELARDSKKGVRGGNDNLRSSQDKAKDKKKNKEGKRAKNPKVSLSSFIFLCRIDSASIKLMLLFVKLLMSYS